MKNYSKKLALMIIIILLSQILLPLISIIFETKFTLLSIATNNYETVEVIGEDSSIVLYRWISSNSPTINDEQHMKDNTDNLQTLVNEVSSNGGGTINIPAGTYYFGITSNKNSNKFADQIIDCKDNVLIVGAGTNESDINKLTIFKPYGISTKGGIDMFFFNDCVNDRGENFLENADFKNFIIDENNSLGQTYTTGGKGFMFNLYRNCDWDNVVVKNTSGTGFGMDCPINCTIRNCKAINCGKGAVGSISGGASGFGIGTGYSNSESLIIENCEAVGNFKFGIFFEHQARFNSTLYKATTAENFLVANCIARGNMYDFGGERANDITYKNCVSEKLKTGENCLQQNQAAFYFGKNSRRISLINCETEYIFSDVTNSSSYYNPVYYGVNNGYIICGKGNTQFNGDENITRANAVKQLWEMAGRPGEVVLETDSVYEVNTGFIDVDKKADYASAILWAKENEIISSGTNFYPNENCTIAQYLNMLYKSVGKPDVEIINNYGGVWYENAINWALKYRIIQGTFNPDDTCSKAQCVTFLYEFKNLQIQSSNNSNSIKASYDVESKTMMITGIGDIKDFNVFDNEVFGEISNSIGYFAKEIENVIIEEGITRIGKNTFRGCNSLKNISIPRSVASIGDYAFLRCQNINICCRSNSYAKEYATTNNFDYEEIEPEIISIDGNPQEWTKDNVTLKINAGDELFGLADTPYSFDGGQTWQKEDSKTYTNNTNNIIIKIKAKDGEEITYRDEINITKISIINYINGIPTEYTHQNVRLTIMTRNPLSTLADVPYSFDNGMTWQEENSKTFLQNTYNVKICVKDNLGNVQEYENINITIHDWKDEYTIDREETCIVNGEKSKHCKGCSAKKDITVIPATGHNYQEVTTPATCTEGGYTTHTCLRCGDNYVDSNTEAIGHNWSNYEVTTPATCTENGEEEKICNRCHETETRVITKLGHNYQAVVTPATCTEGGYTTHTCLRCGDNYVDSNTEALGHDYQNGECIRCGKEELEVITEKYEIIQNNITQINPGTTIKELKENIIANGATLTVYKDSNILEETEKIGTGMTVKVISDNQTFEYTAVVKGDLTGNGEMGDSDLLKLVRYKSGLNNNLRGVFLEAADLNNDNENAGDIDLLKMVRVLAKLDHF